MKSTSAVTAYLRIAPTAINRMDVPIVTCSAYPRIMRVNPLRNMSCGRLLRSSTVRAQSGAFAPPRPLLSEATDQGGRSPVTPPIRLMLALAVVTCAPLATPGSASASRGQVTILQDDHQLLSANGARRDAALDEWKSLGV